MEEIKKKRSFLKTTIIKFLVYLAVGFLCALVYHEIKK